MSIFRIECLLVLSAPNLPNHVCCPFYAEALLRLLPSLRCCSLSSTWRWTACEVVQPCWQVLEQIIWVASGPGAFPFLRCLIFSWSMQGSRKCSKRWTCLNPGLPAAASTMKGSDCCLHHVSKNTLFFDHSARKTMSLQILTLLVFESCSVCASYM